MNQDYKMIEGLKRLKVLTKKMQSNTERIMQYAALPSDQMPQFRNEENQKKEVAGLLQANKDLVAEYLQLKKRIDLTNLKTIVVIGKETYTLADLLILRRGLSKLMQQTFLALDDTAAQQRLRQNRVPSAGGEKPPHVVRFYDETEKFQQIQKCQALDDAIEGRLETLNALTTLLPWEETYGEKVFPLDRSES
jgi:hypothetical protein